MLSMGTILFLMLHDAISNELDALINLLLTFLGSDEHIRITQQTRVLVFVAPHSIDVHLTVVPFAVEVE